MKEWVLWTYSVLVGLLYRFLSLLPVRERTVAIVTYGDNVWPLVERLRAEGRRVTVLAERPGALIAPPRGLAITKLSARTRLFLVPYHLATSSHAILDNYLGELAFIPVRPGTKRFQVWHAAGTLKAFGLEARSTKERGALARRRFERVYRHYGDVIVPGERCGDLFARAMNLPAERFQTLGVPRTDEWVKRFDASRKKRSILYAPTFREDSSFDVLAEVERLAKQIEPLGYTFVVKLHPALSASTIPGVTFVPPTDSIMPHLLEAEIVLTDYSSIPFEACLFQTDVVLYVPDFETYQEDPGVVPSYPVIPGVAVLRGAEAVGHYVSTRNELLNDWSHAWYDREPGEATERIVSHYYR